MNRLISSVLILACLSFNQCNQDQQAIADCKGTTTITPSNHGLQLKSITDTYNELGYLIRSENRYLDPKYDFYETFEYDSKNNLSTHFTSITGYDQYYYEGDLTVKIEYYDLEGVLTGYTTFEYSDNVIIDQSRFTTQGKDTTYNFYYHEGYLDSIVTIIPQTHSTCCYSRLEYLYDESGNNVERRYYTNTDSGGIEILTRYIWQFDANGSKIRYEIRDAQNSLKYGNYYRFKYNDSGNLILTEIYDSHDNKIDEWKTVYNFCKQIKLIKPIERFI